MVAKQATSTRHSHPPLTRLCQRSPHRAWVHVGTFTLCLTRPMKTGGEGQLPHRSRALVPRSARTLRSVPPYQTGVAAQGARAVQHLRLSVIPKSDGAGDG
jgi:hypothetical protein